MMRNYLLRLLTNRSQLILLVLFFSTLPMLRWFAAILLALVTLRLGAKAGSQLVLAMLIPVLLIIIVSKMTLLPALIQVLSVLVLFGLCVLLRATRSWLLLLQLLTVLGLAVVVGVHWLYPDIVNFWIAYLNLGFESLKSLPAFFSQAMPSADMPIIMGYVAHVATGLEVMILSAAALLNVVFGRWLQSALFNPGGLKAELYYLRLSPLYAMVAMGIAVAGLFVGHAWLDCLAVVTLPFIASGLSLMHYLTARSSRQSLWLVFCYVALLLFPPEVLVVLIGASFLDAWWNIRQRYALKR